MKRTIVGNFGDRPKRKMTREQVAKEIKRMRDRDREMVTGIFKNNETPAGKYAGVVKFSYKKYPGDPIEVYEIEDGERVTIPRGVARHLAQDCFYYEHKPLNDDTNVMMGIRTDGSDRGMAGDRSYITARKIHRYSFHSLDFMDEDLAQDVAQPDVVQVSTI